MRRALGLLVGLVFATSVAGAQVAQAPNIALAIPLQLEASPSTGYHATDIRFQVKVTTTKPGPKPNTTYVYVDGARDGVDLFTGTTKVGLCALEWSPTTAGTWAALCSTKRMVTRKPGTYPLTFSVSNAPNDPYSTGTAATTLTLAKTPTLLDLDVAVPKTPGTTRRLEMSLAAKNGLALPGRDVEVLIGAKKWTTKSGSEIEVPLAAGLVEVKMTFAGDDTALPASQTFSVPISDAKACALSLNVSGKKVSATETELTFGVFMRNKWAFPITGIANKTLKLYEFPGDMVTDGAGKAIKTVKVNGPAELWAARPWAVTFSGDGNTTPCGSALVRAAISP